MKDFKTIAIFTFPAEYVILELVLQQKNIRYIFLNATMIAVLPFHSNALGGIKLMVHPEDIDKALKIMSTFNDSADLRIV